MQLMKIPVVASSTLVDNKFFYINVEDVFEIEGAVSGADTSIIRFSAGASDSLVTVTFDGATAAEKVLNAKKFADYFADKCAELNGPNANRKPVNRVFNLIPSLGEFETLTGITKTGGSGGDAIKTIALS